jgi:hypothetical protein
MARRKAQSHALSEFGDRKATIFLKLRKNLSINPVHLEESPILPQLNDHL